VQPNRGIAFACQCPGYARKSIRTSEYPGESKPHVRDTELPVASLHVNIILQAWLLCAAAHTIGKAMLLDDAVTIYCWHPRRNLLVCEESEWRRSTS
jgi:hypothetical protein